MLKIYKSLIFVVTIALVGYCSESCNIINPSEPVPTYIHIDSFHFVKNPLLSQLPATSQISNVWVYYNNNPIGAFDLPATVPILANGTGSVELFPGIIVDGLNNEVSTYTFYTADTFSLEAQPGKTITVNPRTEFQNDVVQTWISNFVSAASVTFKLVSGNVPFETVSPYLPGSDSLTENGSYSGSLKFNSPGDSSEDSSTVEITIPNSQEAFIEFDYKCSIPFYVGLAANLSSIVSSTPYYLAGIYPSNTWQKFYLAVADFNAQYQGTSYTFYVKSMLPAGTSYGRVLIENIQLITF